MAIDSQSVRKREFINLETGIDGGKKINGVKRTILVDMIGIPWSIKVTATNVFDNQAGVETIEKLKGKVPRLQKITAHNGYKTTFIEHVNKEFKWKVEIARGHQVKNQNRFKDSFLKRIDGKSKDNSDGSILSVGCLEILRKS